MNGALQLQYRDLTPRSVQVRRTDDLRWRHHNWRLDQLHAFCPPGRPGGQSALLARTEDKLFSNRLLSQTVFAFQSLLSIFPQFMEAIGASVRVFELLDRVPRVNYDGECFALMDPVISTRYGLRISCIFTLNS